MPFRFVKEPKIMNFFFHFFLVFFVLSFFISTYCTLVNGFDPCEAYEEINDPYRSTKSRLKPGMRANCDISLLKGWYRFTSIVGGKIPTTKPEPFHCNTIAPIWMKGDLPKTKGTQKRVTACVNLFNRAGGCKRKFSMFVKYCDGGNKKEFYVYKLSPVRGCAMAYCAGNETPCPRGMTGIQPNCNVSQIVEFPYSRVPRPRVDYVKNATNLTMSCKFDFPPWNNVSYFVKWYANSKFIRKQEMCVNVNSTCERNNLESRIHYTVKNDKPELFKVGQNLQCAITMKYSTSPDNKWSIAKYSNNFYVGIEMTPRVTHIVVKECDSNTYVKITLRPTVPIYRNAYTPEIDYLTLSVVAPKNQKKVAVNTCSVKLRTEDISSGKNITIKGICNSLKDGVSQSKIYFVPETTYLPWRAYRPPALLVWINTTEIKTCSGTGDPHYKTFDGKVFHFYKPGNYLMYSNANKTVEVQTRLWTCGSSSVSCHCGVVIRERNEIVTLSVCNDILIHKSSELFPITIRRNKNGFYIATKSKGSFMDYDILLPSGTRVKVFRTGWGIDVFITAPGTDRGNVSGLCGNFDGDPNNDLKGSDGKLYQDSRYPGHQLFGSTWEIHGKTYFETYPNKLPKRDDDGLFCTCLPQNSQENNTDCDKIGSFYFDYEYGKQQNGNSGQKGAREAQKKKRFAPPDSEWYSDDIIDHVERSYYVDDPQVQQAMNRIRSKRSFREVWSKEEATDYCRSHIEETKAGKSCKDVSGASIGIAMVQCIADLELTGDPAYAYSAFEFMAHECKNAIFTNISLYTKSPDGDLVPPTDVVEDLCPADCSGHGKCTNRTCICDEGFTALDCSMDVNAVPEVLGIYNGGLCDLRERPCRKTNIMGQNFISSENLTCHVQEIKVYPGSWSPRGFPVKLHGDMYDLYGVKCDLPEPPTRLGDYDNEGTPAGGLLISVSNDGFNVSLQKRRHVSYDSKCINCSKLIETGKCEPKPNSCLIRGHCFAPNEPNPRDWCQQCIPRDDQNSWTRRKINQAPKFTINRTMFAVRGENLLIQLKATDPDNRPVKYSLLSSTATSYTLSTTGLLRWMVISNEKFTFKVTDECGAFDTTDMRVRIVQCPCLNGGHCVPHPYHPRGSGLYQCKCVNGFSGDRCERCPGLVCPPRKVSVTTLSSTKIEVKWVEPQDKALDYYLLEYGPKKQKPRIQRVSKIVTSWTLTGLRKFTDYRIGVCVLNGNRKKKVEVWAKTAEDVPDAPPLITGITPVSHDSMKVTWSPIAEHKRNGIIKGYKIYYKAGLPNGNWGKWKSLTIRDANTKSAIISRLIPATSYCFKMSAFTRKGQYRLWMTSACWLEKTAPLNEG